MRCEKTRDNLGAESVAAALANYFIPIVQSVQMPRTRWHLVSGTDHLQSKISDSCRRYRAIEIRVANFALDEQTWILD